MEGAVVASRRGSQRAFAAVSSWHARSGDATRQALNLSISVLGAVVPSQRLCTPTFLNLIWCVSNKVRGLDAAYEMSREYQPLL